MTAVKFVLVGLALMVLAGCIIRNDGNGPGFDRGQGEDRNQLQDHTAAQSRGDYQSH